MIQSMTGYSRISRRLRGGIVTVECRSTNHRYLEVSQRLPAPFSAFEPAVTQLVRGRIQRGRIELTVAADLAAIGGRRVIVNNALAKQYRRALTGLRTQLGLKGPISFEHVLALPQIVSVVEDPIQERALWPAVRQVVEAALQSLRTMRQREGRRLVRDITAHIRTIRARASTVRRRLPRGIAEQKRRFRERVQAILGDGQATRSYVQEAVAAMKDTDIHEELIRLESHLVQLERGLHAGETVGKKADFLAQELMREANTMGAKANDSDITRAVIDIKAAIEKIREQVQNLE